MVCDVSGFHVPILGFFQHLRIGPDSQSYVSRVVRWAVSAQRGGLKLTKSGDTSTFHILASLKDLNAKISNTLWHSLTTTPRKINMEPENPPLEEENHLPNHHFQVPAVNLRGCNFGLESRYRYLSNLDVNLQLPRSRPYRLIASKFTSHSAWKFWIYTPPKLPRCSPPKKTFKLREG